jgi:hypothetical protein
MVITELPSRDVSDASTSCQLPMANTNEDISGKSEDEIVVIFFKELKAFQKKLAPFDRI